jgi:hypothetical protein
MTCKDSHCALKGTGKDQCNLLTGLCCLELLIRKPGKKQCGKCIGRRDLHPDAQEKDFPEKIGEIGETDAVLLGGDDPGGAALRREKPEGLDIGTAVGMVVGEGLKGDDLRTERCQTPPEGLRRADSGESEYLLTLESRGG